MSTRRVLREHAAVLTFYLSLSLAISWPLARDFSTVLTGSGLDALSHLWGVWHAVQAFAGREPLFSTTLLYYPVGTSLLLQSAGPVSGVLALPFWPLGPVAGYNGGLLLGLTLTGYAMYLLARDIGCSRGASLFAGVVLLTAPVHLVGLRGQLAKVFLGLMPLSFLVLRRGLDLQRSAWWAVAFGAAALVVLLHSPLQFFQVALAAPVFAIGAALTYAEKRRVARRAGALAIAATVATTPLLIEIVRASRNPAMAIERGLESPRREPDLLQFVVPSSFSRFFGSGTTATLERWSIAPGVDTEVSVPLTAFALSGVALAAGVGRVWLAVALAGVVLALGAELQAFGHDTFTSSHLAVSLPYGWLTSLPGFDFLRAPTVFMQVGFVGIAAAAGLALTLLARRGGSWRFAGLAATVFLLIEVWPAAWRGQALPVTPALYHRLSADRDSYGVLDLPIRSRPDVSTVDFSARYQAQQIIHRKGIVAGHVSRAYAQHPVSPCVFADDRAPRDVRVNGQPSRCEPAAVHQLASHGYRFVVWHKPSKTARENLPGSWAALDAQAFVRGAFGDSPPVEDDELASVWKLPSADESLPATPVVELGPGWYPAEPEWRWATSPATVVVTASRPESAELVVTLALLHDLQTERPLGKASTLIVTTGMETLSFPVTPGGSVRVPLTLVRGSHTVSLSLGSGNFRPADYGEPDIRILSFAIESLDLIVGN